MNEDSSSYKPTYSMSTAESTTTSHNFRVSCDD
uniref:Uncharacterized protein n=1 Tax=Globisporangium ultimum (strain ATCC 200006 / CBS 805.95 / DAOM BR144) TaxID=431595 RepID=K3XDD6_GLOUD